MADIEYSAGQVQASRYNFFARKKDGTFLAYNALTGALAILSEDVQRRLKQGEGVTELAKSDPSLVENGFIAFECELGVLRGRYEKARMDFGRFAFTVAPTIACNFDCFYCYQSHADKRTMKAETVDRLEGLFDAIAETGKRSFALTWFGGEPLLAFKQVLSTTTRLRRRCEKRNIRFDGASMITNGDLLSEEKAQKLIDVGIDSFQISFDSLIYQRPKHRGLFMPNGDPSSILVNALSLMNKVKVNIRINVGRHNRDDMQQCRTKLRELGFVGGVHFARIHHEESGIGWGVEANDHTIPSGEFAQYRKREFADAKSYARHIMNELTPRSHYCGATKLSLYTIDATGDVYRCWHSVDKKMERYFNLYEIDFAKNDIWQSYSPLKYESCANCKVLPLCMGGCSHGRVFGLNSEPPCEPIKFEISEMIDFLAESVQFK